jgi:rRNA-processing protein FCF1
MYVLLDTSFLLIAVDRPISLFEKLVEIIGKFDFILLEDTIHELISIRKSGSLKKSKLARKALESVSGYQRMIHSFNGDVDEKIVDYAFKNKVIVATVDKILRKKLRSLKIPVITLKKNKLMVEGSMS